MWFGRCYSRVTSVGTPVPPVTGGAAGRTREVVPKCGRVHQLRCGGAELRARYRFTDLRSFLDLYYADMTVLRTERDFFDLAVAYLRRAREQGVRHAEIFFDPQAYV
jgi:adenosine/AMP deaminase-like protein